MEIDPLTRPETSWLIPSAIIDYKRLLHDLWFRLVRLNHSLFFMRVIEGVPWDLLFGPDGYTFWAFTYRSHGDTAVLLIHGLLNDNATDHLSLDRLKNRLVNEWVQPEKKKELCVLLAKCRQPNQLNQVLKKIESIRHSHIAHTLIPQIDPKSQPLRASLVWTELDDLFEYLCSYLDIMGLGVEYKLAWPGSGYDVQSKQKSDLDLTLNAFLATSGLIHWPESRPEVWSIKRENLPVHELAQFNAVRMRLGLAPA